jgi:ATP-binding cassette subfamily B (MDR/TAP) protein 1
LNDNLSISQAPSTEDERNKMETIPYASGVESIMYGMVCTRPDIAHAVSMVSRFMCNLGQAHWSALKWIFRYLNGSSDYGLKFKRTAKVDDCLFVDADYARCMDTVRSISAYVFTLF